MHDYHLENTFSAKQAPMFYCILMLAIPGIANCLPVIPQEQEGQLATLKGISFLLLGWKVSLMKPENHNTTMLPLLESCTG